MHTHHAIDYIEFTVRDVAAAKRFYAKAFGWSFTDYGPEYAGIKGSDGGEVGGLRRGDEARTRGPLVILYSDDLEASLAAVDGGGRIDSRSTVLVPRRPPLPLRRSERQRARGVVEPLAGKSSPRASTLEKRS